MSAAAPTVRPPSFGASLTNTRDVPSMYLRTGQGLAKDLSNLSKKKYLPDKLVGFDIESTAAGEYNIAARSPIANVYTQIWHIDTIYRMGAIMYVGTIYCMG